MRSRTFMALPIIASLGACKNEPELPFDCTSALEQARVLRDSVGTLASLIKNNTEIGSKPGLKITGYAKVPYNYVLETLPQLQKTHATFTEAYATQLADMGRKGCNLELTARR